MKERLNQPIIPITEQEEIFNIEGVKQLRRLAVNLEQKIGERFPLVPTGEALRFEGREFIKVERNGESSWISFSSIGQSQLEKAQTVRLVSGTCLFGATGLMAVDDTGRSFSLTDPLAEPPYRELVRLRRLDSIHPSEAESALRLTKAIKMLVNQESQGRVRLHFHLPLPEYLLYLVKNRQSGRLSEDLFAEAVEVVVGHAEKIEKMFAKRLPEVIEPQFESPLSTVVPRIFEQKGKVTLDELTGCLSERDELWQQLIEKFPPRSIIELCYLSYTYEYHYVQRLAQAEGSGFLAVEESKESRILTEVKKQAAALQAPLALNALYVAPRVITQEGLHGKKELFMLKNDGEPILPQLKTVVRAYRREKK